MNTKELIEALGQLKVQTGSLACLGCGHEHSCGVHGCVLIREAVTQLTSRTAGSTQRSACRSAVCRC